jgi:capsid protein
MCQTAYGWWMGEVMMSEEQYFNVPDYFTDHFVREAWNYCEWPGPVPTSLDPLKEAEANKMAQEQGWVSNTRIAAQQYGTDFDVEQSQLAEEKKQRDKLGLTPEPPAPPKLPFGKGKGKDAEDETKTKDDASGAGDKDGES